MDFIEGVSLKQAAAEQVALKDHIPALLLELFFCELFQLRCVQTDPNPANYQYNLQQDRLVLLDFGAVRRFSIDFVLQYHHAICAATDRNAEALAPALLAKHLIPLMPKDQRAVFAALSARVGSIGDNRLGGWYSYRASKAALNMLLRCTAIEAKRRWPKLVVVGLHPGTVDTPLSQPFQARVPDGKLFTPEFSARSLLQVIDGLTPADSGNVYAWDGQLIQP
jgi:NAD(P)-dependent dehydrogenase (short-subunit alcohol dehydrogenase family)